jgi:hypothetical protein
MSRILAAALTPGLIVVLATQSNGSYAVSAEDYGCLWWAHGSPYYYTSRTVPADNIPEDYPGKKQVLCFHTGKYGMAIDTINLDRVNLGLFTESMPYEADIAEVDRAVSSLPESKLSIGVCSSL